MRKFSGALFSMPNCEIPMRLMFPSWGGWGYLFKKRIRMQDMVLFVLVSCDRILSILSSACCLILEKSVFSSSSVRNVYFEQRIVFLNMIF